MKTPFPDAIARRRAAVRSIRAMRLCGVVVATLFVAACAVGPDYRKPLLDVPAQFKEGVDWQRVPTYARDSISNTWWLAYQDNTLSHLIAQALNANQSIISAEAAYRLSRAGIDANQADLFPSLAGGVSATRSGLGPKVPATGAGSTANLVDVNLSASWEPDLWGQIRRDIESARASAQASDAQLAGVRLSIAASVASDYFALRQADVDIDLLSQQQRIDQHLLEMTRADFLQGTASNDTVLTAQDALEAVLADLQAAQISREQDEHAIAVLAGVPPANFSLAPQRDYIFTAPSVPPGLPSQLLERRYDVVSAERTAAAANAKIGVAEAAFFPALTLSAEGGFEHNALANVFTMPGRVWTLGPDLAATIFDGGARTAAVHEAQAAYDEDVANYRETVLTAFQNVEDSLSSYQHLNRQAQSFIRIYQSNGQLFASVQAQAQAGTASEQSVLTQHLALLQTEQNLKDTQASLAQSSVMLVKNLGGGWRWNDAHGTATQDTTESQ